MWTRSANVKKCKSQDRVQCKPSSARMCMLNNRETDVRQVPPMKDEGSAAQHASSSFGAAGAQLFTAHSKT
jgi:hypothetical protein